MKKKTALRNLGEDAKVVAYCYFHLDELREAGLIHGVQLQLSEDGRREVQELIDEGYSPSAEDCADALQFILSGGESEMGLVQ